MVKVFTQNPSAVHPEAIQALRKLPDDFWVLAEFYADVQIDWLVVRPVPDDRPAGVYSTAFLTEMKHTQRPWRGINSSVWQQLDGDTWVDLDQRPRYINPWQQVLFQCQVLAEWLVNSHLAFSEPQLEAMPTGRDFRAWPALLILSPDGIEHRLPSKGEGSFGSYYFDLDSWVHSIAWWRPNQGMRLTNADLRNIVELLQMIEIQSPESASGTDVIAQTAQHKARTAATAMNGNAPHPSFDENSPGLEWIEGLTRWAVALEQRVSELERGIKPPLPRMVPPSRMRALTPAEADVLVKSLTAERTERPTRVCDFPTLLNRINDQLTSRLKDQVIDGRGYAGFGSARAYFDQAVTQGLMQYGPLSGPAPSIYLADEALPTEKDPSLARVL